MVTLLAKKKITTKLRCFPTALMGPLAGIIALLVYFKKLKKIILCIL